MTEAEIATAAGISPTSGYVRRVLRRARANRQVAQSTESGAIPTLELCSGPNPNQCNHSMSTSRPDGHRYCLWCDAISIDGGRSWLPRNSDTPNLAVLAPDRNGRSHRLKRLQDGSRIEQSGPTKHRPDPDGLAGGKGR